LRIRTKREIRTNKELICEVVMNLDLLKWEDIFGFVVIAMFSMVASAWGALLG
jgi:hypothetical protein